jgi:hypothetical protein
MSKRWNKEGTTTIISMLNMLDMRDNYNLTAKGYSGDKPYLEITNTRASVTNTRPDSLQDC